VVTIPRWAILFLEAPEQREAMMTKKAEGPSAGNAGATTIMEGEQGEKPSVQPTPPTPTRKQRIAGLNRGTIKLNEDFDEPLPDAFWFGVE